MPATTNTWGGTAYTGEYIKIDLGATYRIKNYYVRSSAANYIETTPSIWYVGVSTDNATYTLWDSRSGEAWSSQSTKTYTPSSNATARYIIFVVNKTGSGGTSFRSQPRIASLYFDYDTLNYDITLIRNITCDTITTSGAITGTTLTASGLITANAGLTGTTLTTSGLITANAGLTGTTLTASGLITANAGLTGTTLTASGLITANAALTGTTLTTSGLITANGGLDMSSQSITNVNQLNAKTVSTWLSEHTANNAKVSADGTIDTHSDVVITTPANGQLLTYNGTNWVNSTGSLTYLQLTGGTMSGDIKLGTSAFTLYTAPQTMTSNNSGGFVASASNEYNPAYYAFNADQNDYWTTNIYYNDTTGVYTRPPATTNTWGGIGYTGEYINFDLGAIYRIKTYYVRSSSANFIETTPSIWYVGTSADNITYTLWDSRSGEAWASQTTKTYNPASNATARYIIFVVNKTGSGGTSFRSQPRIASLYFHYETFNYDITNVRNMTGYTLTTSGAITASGLITASGGLTGTTLTASGLITANAGVDMKSQIMLNLATPSASTDGANKTYVDTLDGQNVKLTGTQTMSGTKEFSGILATSVGVPCIIGRNAATGGLELYGTNNNMNGPHIQAFVNTSVYPTFQLLNWGQDNINLYFDCYYNGTSILSSNTSSNFQIAKYANKLSFNYKNGGTLGQ